MSVQHIGRSKLNHLETFSRLLSMLEYRFVLSSEFRYLVVLGNVLSRCLIMLEVLVGKCFVHKLVRANNIFEIR